MTQRDRDRLVVLKKAEKKLIKQSQAARELGISCRQVKRLVRALRERGDEAVIHGLRGRASPRKTGTAKRERIVRILSQEKYRGFGPTLASEYLANKHQVTIGREALRQIMIAGGLWRARRQKAEEAHQWRPRRSCRGELVQWDTSEHDWLEGRGEKLYLIHMIDDATSELTARFVRSDSTEENMRLLWNYLEQHGRPVAFYTDKAAMFQSTPKIARDRKQLPREEREPLPPTQMGRALQELGIVWIAAHSPQAKGRVERSFGTAQDRLVKGLRIAGAKTLEQANRYLEGEFVPWWNQHLVVDPAHPTDAHRPLGTEHNLAAALSRVETRQVNSDYTVQLDGKRYGIVSATMPAGLRGAVVRLERRLNGSLAVRFRDRYLGLEECGAVRQPKPARAAGAEPTQRRSRQPHRPTEAARAAKDAVVGKPGLPVWQAAQIDRTRTPDTLD
jgi:transposase